MSNYVNIGSVTRDQTIRAMFTSDPVAVALLPNTVYRLCADEECYIDFSASGYPQEDPTSPASGVLLPPNVPEYFASTTDKDTLFVASSISGSLWVSRILGAKI